MFKQCLKSIRQINFWYISARCLVLGKQRDNTEHIWRGSYRVQVRLWFIYHDWNIHD